MKKYVITGVLCFFVCLSFGQKKAISAAKNEIKGGTPNIAEARILIKGALANPETANDAEAWYVAGQIENKQFDKEREKEILGKQADDVLMYSALESILPYFLKAVELDQIPDAKGNIKPKYTKDIKSIIRANRPFYINAGIYAFDNKNFQKAYENFKVYGDIPYMSMFENDKWNVSKSDTTEMQFRYYAAVAAAAIPNSKEAIAIYEEIKNTEYTPNVIFSENDIYQRLMYEYNQLDDSVAYEKIMIEGFKKFPEEDYYILNLINFYINAGKSAEAISYLEKAIAQQPVNAQYYDVLGQIYEQTSQSDDAIVNLKKALELDPDNIEYLSHLGRVYFNLAVEKRSESDEISNQNQANDVLKKAKDYFKESLPYFEKVFQLDPKNSSAIYALRSVYYSLTMWDDYYKMDALFSADDD